ncbi:aspartyl-tRNA amidotransferase [Clostridium carboxidivorans P7]|uniref:GatB/YqeY domain-containing protein n=1 Tax=Clostridium carboxidivorans P7 TaxID=536227 RepID=C6PTZ3_9CLOT|nr:GatB/YqeY domain-containing protein [Clostridium carboxidivorans]AKN33649.1 aspartyl-tRNA amidotransferase [Clostridium carboxidivorans P7]EET87292.1 GatB/YqeY domain-containing protein [Clostridium carboxidivorans P7]EFG86756.1 yqey-like protein [Clostridium carboxidivorans P7]
MSLKERLQEDWKQALKAKEKSKAETISMARAAVLQVEKTDGNKLSDEQVIEVLAKEVKQMREAILEFEKGNRQDLVDKANEEIEILLGYLPQQLSEEEISEIVRQAVDEVGAGSIKDMGKVMTLIMPKTKGRADGKLVSQIVKQYLNK